MTEGYERYPAGSALETSLAEQKRQIEDATIRQAQDREAQLNMLQKQADAVRDSQDAQKPDEQQPEQKATASAIELGTFESGHEDVDLSKLPTEESTNG